MGNRGVAALLQRLVPTVAPIAPAQEPGGDQASSAEEAAGLAAAARRRADARRLLPAEVQEVSELVSLLRPQGPGAVMGPGTKKLLDAVDRLGTHRAGGASDYKRDPASAAGLPSFVAGTPDDPDGRITINANGVLEVMRTKRVQPRANKGKPPPPPTVTHDTVVVDLLGQTFKLEKKPKERKSDPDSFFSVADTFLHQGQRAVEAEAQTAILASLRKSDTPVAGDDPDVEHMTVGEVVTEATSGVYLQRSYINNDP